MKLKGKLKALRQIDFKKLAFGGYWLCLSGFLTGILLVRLVHEEGWCFGIFLMTFVYIFAIGFNYIWNTIWFLITK